jgi:hypothetical protein
MHALVSGTKLALHTVLTSPRAASVPMTIAGVGSWTRAARPRVARSREEESGGANFDDMIERCLFIVGMLSRDEEMEIIRVMS